MKDDLVVNIEVGGLTISMPESHFKELTRIIKEGPLYENEIKIESLSEILFLNRLLVRISVGNYHEKVAASKLGARVALAFEDTIAMRKLTDSKVFRSEFFNAEITQIADITKGNQDG